MANYQKIKGTRDFYGDKSIKLAFIENVTRDVAIKYGYGEIVTPIFENTDVFVKNVGEDSDVVNLYHYVKEKEILGLKVIDFTEFCEKYFLFIFKSVCKKTS